MNTTYSNVCNNIAAYDTFADITRQLDEEGRTGGWPVRNGLWTAWYNAYQVVYRTMTEAVQHDALEVGDVLYSPDLGRVKVFKTWTRQFAGRVVMVSTDGHNVDVNRLHVGGEIGDVVGFEIWGADGREEHGWADATSRRVTQVG